MTRLFPLFGLTFFAMLTLCLPDAFAQDTVNDVIKNIEESSENLPGLASAFAYLTGVLMAVLGILKTIDHVSAPTQTPIRQPIVRFLIGGGLFSLPIILEAANRTINGGSNTLNLSNNASGFINGVSGAAMDANVKATASTGLTVNSLFDRLISDSDYIPGLIAIIAYMLGVLISISGLLKIREHVDDPTRTAIREPVIRLLIAGALFSLPTVYTAMYQTLADGGFGTKSSVYLGTILTSFFLSSEATSLLVSLGPISFTTAGIGCNPAASLTTTFKNNTIGDVICTLEANTMGLPLFLTGLSYILGLIFGLWGLFKIRDHVLDPTRTGLHEGVTRLLAGGAFFALPFIATVLNWTINTGPLAVFNNGSTATNTGFKGSIVCGVRSTNSLDMAMACLANNVLGPMQSMINFFCFSAGMIFIMIGISRIIRSSQEGARGPGGRGTLATFITGALLISANAFVRAASSTLFVNPITRTNAALAYSGGMTVAEQNATLNVISAVVKFLIVIGMISFVRGIFIMRDVAEGNQQASVMSGMTHIIGGALAVNFGPLMNAVQVTLGVTAFGVQFT